MPRTVPLLLVALAFFVISCGGEDSPTVTPTLAAPPSPIEATPPPSTPGYGIVGLPPLPPARTLNRLPANGLIQQPSQTREAPQLLFHVPASGRTVALEVLQTKPVSWGWTAAGDALANTSSGLVLYAPAGNTAQRLDLPDEVSLLLVARTPRAAIRLASQQIAVLDLATWQLQPIALNATPVAWAPDGKRLLVRIQDSGPAVLLLDQAVPRLYTLPVAIGQEYVGWVSDTALLALQPPVAQVVDISGPAPRVTQRPFAYTSVSLHEGAVRLAAGGAPGGVTIHDALSLRPERDLPGLWLGAYPVPSYTQWSKDARLILLTAGHCTADARIVLVDVTTGAQRVVARAAPFQLALSPDTRQVAYTADTSLYVVPADGAAAPRQVFDKVHDPSPIAWSPDGGAIGFVHFMGGYDGGCG